VCPPTQPELRCINLMQTSTECPRPDQANMRLHIGAEWWVEKSPKAKPGTIFVNFEGCWAFGENSGGY
jgi:hypothetical protein